MGVASDGSYGVKEGIIYSFPVTCSGGQYKIVQGALVAKVGVEQTFIVCLLQG